MSNTGSMISLAERQEMAARARQRAEDRIEEREHIRLELKTREYIHEVHKSIDALQKGYEMQRDPHTKAEIEVPLDRSRVQAIKAAADLSLRLLNKVLPDLKAIEVIKPPGDADDPKNLSTGQLYALIEKLGHRPAVQIEEAEITEQQWEEPGW